MSISDVSGLPDGIRACLFDLDGVLTRTAAVHAAAWKDMFDQFLRRRAETGGEPFVPFTEADYLHYVDGKRRLDGVRSFLASRGITLPDGTADDPVTAETVNGLGNAKNVIIHEHIRNDGVEVFADARRYLDAVRDAGLRRAVVSSSANTAEVLAVTGLDAYFELRVDGVIAAERHLPGKPAPDTFLAAAAEMGLEPEEAAVFEDALAGVAAGRAGNFGYVVGVDRVGQADELARAGADVVVTQLTELLGP